MAGLLKIMVSTAVVVVLACAAAVVLVPPVPRARMAIRHELARDLVGRIVDAAWARYRERGRFPPGDGSGSADLVRALREPSRTGLPYLDLPPEMLTPSGDIRNPLDPGGGVIRYRLDGCGTTGEEGCGFEVWCDSSDGWEVGACEWAPLVPRP